MRVYCHWAVIAPILCVSACLPAEEPAAHEELLKEFLKSAGEATNVLKDIKSGADVSEKQQKLSGHLHRSAELVNRLDALGRVDEEKRAQLDRKYREKMADAASRWLAECSRLMEFDAFKEIGETPEFSGISDVLFDWAVVPIRGDPAGSNHLIGIEQTPDNRPGFEFDHTRPFHLELGRGSGWHGLDTVAVNERGQVVLHRQGPQGQWQSAAMSIPPEALTALAKAVADPKILKMARMYSATGVHDGTQWVFWLKQGDHEKSIYFNNHFPEAIQDFAVYLDELLAKNGLGKVTWTDVPVGEERKHEKAIWESIRDPKPAK